jgi:PilZ domain-containing protein
MNPIRTGQSEKNAVEKIGGERRSDRRYDIDLDVRWKLIHRRRVLDSGIGKTLDVSSGGLLIEIDRELRSGLNIELSITWPVLLHNLVPLQLVVAGRVVRTRGRRVGVRMVQHEFRTVSMPTEPGAELELIPYNGMAAKESSTDKSH